MFIDKEKISPAVTPSTTKNAASSWIEIDKKAFEHNVSQYKNIIHPAALLAVIKSNAYGHGIELIAKQCDQLNPVDYIGVVTLQEALHLRSIGIKKQLLVLSIVIGDLQEAIAQNIDLIAYDFDTILELNALGKILNKKARIHIKIDTGLSRLGLRDTDIVQFIADAHQLPFIQIRGIFTHLADSESEDPTFTNHQIEQFDRLIKHLEERGVNIPFKHAACSAAASAHTKSRFNLVRVGIGLYGLWPSPENKKMTLIQQPSFSLQPVLTWKTKIIQIKDIPAGSYIGYDRTHQVTQATRIAIIPVGYWDGYDRRLSNKGHVLINNQHAPILGRIAMNLSVIDVTGLTITQNDEVTLLGNHPGITADDLAQHCNTINYEIVTRINPLLPRY